MGSLRYNAPGSSKSCSRFVVEKTIDRRHPLEGNVRNVHKCSILVLIDSVPGPMVGDASSEVGIASSFGIAFRSRSGNYDHGDKACVGVVYPGEMSMKLGVGLA
ncbi:unnamed protein product [Cochlearia groenlandica]